VGGGTTFRAAPAAVSGGTIYRLAPPAVTGGAWTEMVLHSFGGVGDGTKPQAGPVFGQNGALYGSTEYSLVPSGRGMVYELMPPASGSAAVPWAEIILHVFPGSHSGVAMALLAAGVGQWLESKTLSGALHGRAPPSTSSAFGGFRYTLACSRSGFV